MKDSGLTGIAMVVLGVEDLDATRALFRQANGWQPPVREEHKEFRAKMAHFSGTPVVLVAPLDKSPWLADLRGVELGVVGQQVGWGVGTLGTIKR